MLLHFSQNKTQLRDIESSTNKIPIWGFYLKHDHEFSLHFAGIFPKIFSHFCDGSPLKFFEFFCDLASYDDRSFGTEIFFKFPKRFFDTVHRLIHYHCMFASLKLLEERLSSFFDREKTEIEVLMCVKAARDKC